MRDSNMSALTGCVEHTMFTIVRRLVGFTHRTGDFLAIPVPVQQRCHGGDRAADSRAYGRKTTIRGPRTLGFLPHGGFYGNRLAGASGWCRMRAWPTGARDCSKADRSVGPRLHTRRRAEGTEGAGHRAGGFPAVSGLFLQGLQEDSLQAFGGVGAEGSQGQGGCWRMIW